MAAPDDTTEIPAPGSMPRVPGYDIEKRLASGATATVYLAVQQSLERRVALKIMAASLVADGSFRQRFLKEGKIVGQLSHPHIITVYDIGVHGEYYFMAMEYVSGGTLKELIAHEQLPSRRTREIFRQIADALGYAHQRGFIHRDVKPANILFRDNGMAVLSDFGIAKAISSATQITAAGWTVGTPDYMSPEQALGRPLNAQSDLYSLGSVLYEMLAGEKPFQGTDPIATALMHVESPIPQLPDWFAHYQPLLGRVLAKDPQDRFTAAEHMIAALDAIDAIDGPEESPVVDDAPTQAIAVATNTAPGPPFPRWLYGLGLLALAGGTGLAFYLKSDEQPAGPSRLTARPTATVPADSPPLEPRLQEQIANLLQVAEAHREVGYLTGPPGMNAAETYRRTLALDPNNAQALDGLRAIADRYAAMARESLRKREDPAAVLEQIEAGLSVNADHRELLALRRQLAP